MHWAALPQKSKDTLVNKTPDLVLGTGSPVVTRCEDGEKGLSQSVRTGRSINVCKLPYLLYVGADAIDYPTKPAGKRAHWDTPDNRYASACTKAMGKTEKRFYSGKTR
jgi:hypothetical protein